MRVLYSPYVLLMDSLTHHIKSTHNDFYVKGLVCGFTMMRKWVNKFLARIVLYF